jgi:hypothetical protein
MPVYVHARSAGPLTEVKAPFERTARSGTSPTSRTWPSLSTAESGRRPSEFRGHGMRRLRNCAPIRASYWAACAAGLLLAQAGRAQTVPASGSGAVVEDPGTNQARALFNEGADQARHGDWPKALAAFERSEALHPHPVTAYNIGYCERALGRAMRARKMLGKALADNVANGGLKLPEQLATAAKTYLGELQQQVARTLISVSPEGASIVVDGRPLERATADGPRPVLWAGTREPGPGEPAMASTFELELDAGDHVFVVSKAGYLDEVTIRTFEPGHELTVVLQLSPRAGTAADRTHSSSARAGGHSAVPWVVASAGGALLITGAVLFSVGAGDVSSAIQACPGPTHVCPSDQASAPQRQSLGYTLENWGGLVGLGGGLALGVGLVWHFLEKPSDSASPLAPKSGLAASEVDSRGGVPVVRFAPWVMPNGAGILGTF